MGYLEIEQGVKLRMEKVFNVKQVSEYLQISTKTILGYIKNGKLKAFKVGREWRIRETSLNEFIQALEKE